MMLAWLSASEMMASFSPSTGLEQSAVGVPARGIEDGVLGAEEARQRGFELLVHGLRAADEAHRRHAVAVAVDGAMRRLADRRVAGEAQVVVSAEVDDVGVVGADLAALGAGDHALGLEQALLAQVVELGIESLVEGRIHEGTSGKGKLAQLYWPPRWPNRQFTMTRRAPKAVARRCASIAGCGARGTSSRGTLAAEAVAGGKVHVNGQRVKPAHAVRVGDRLSLTRQGYDFECEVLKLPATAARRPSRRSCYAETDTARAAREKFAEQSRLVSAFAQPRSLERPDKHGRRELRRLRGRD